MAKLIERCRVASVSRGGEVDRYGYRFWPFGWMIVYVDHWGALSILSDYGNWQHAWGGGPDSWGHPTFLKFLESMSHPGYIWDKLNYGRTREVPDPEATKKRMNEHVDDLIMTPDEADELREQIDNFCEGLEDSLDVGYLCAQGCEELNLEFDCLHEWVVNKRSPAAAFLHDEVLPVFLAHLGGTLKTITAEEWEERHGR